MIRWLCSNALIQTARSYHSKSSAAGNSAGLILSKGKPPLSKRQCRRPLISGEPAKLALPACSSAEGYLKYYTAYREAEGGCWKGHRGKQREPVLKTGKTRLCNGFRCRWESLEKKSEGTSTQLLPCPLCAPMGSFFPEGSVQYWICTSSLCIRTGSLQTATHKPSA